MIGWLIHKIIEWSWHLENKEHCKIMEINPYREIFIYYRRNGDVRVSISKVTKGNKIIFKSLAGISVDRQGNVNYTGEGHERLELQTPEVKTQ